MTLNRPVRVRPVSLRVQARVNPAFWIMPKCIHGVNPSYIYRLGLTPPPPSSYNSYVRVEDTDTMRAIWVNPMYMHTHSHTYISIF